MKKMLIMLAVAISIVGCEKSGEEAAKDINNEGDSALAYAKQGMKEYNEADRSTSLDSMSDSQLEANRAKYVASMASLTTARAKYANVLKLANENKDTVKVSGKQSVVDAIAAIDAFLPELSFRIEEIDAHIKARSKKRAS